jgi:hypothetical protein
VVLAFPSFSQTPVPALHGDRAGERAAGELAGELDMPGLQPFGQGQRAQQRRAGLA